MKTVFDKSTREDLIRRIDSLQENSRAQWGKMTVLQMARHCTAWEEMIHQNKRYERPLIGRLIGKLILKSVMKDDRPLRKNTPTIPDLIITNNDIDLQKEKLKWMVLLQEYATYAYPDHSFVHPFFGRMSREEIGIMVYKHNDHHLRQFNG